MRKINGKGIGKSQPSDRGKDSSRKLLPRFLLSGRNNGVKSHEGKQEHSHSKEKAQADDNAGRRCQDREKMKQQVLNVLAEDQKHQRHDTDQHKDQRVKGAKQPR